MCLREADHSDKCVIILTLYCAGNTISMTITVDIDLNKLAEIVFVRFFHYKVTLFLPLSILYFLGKKVIMCSSHLNSEWRVLFPLPED